MSDARSGKPLLDQIFDQALHGAAERLKRSDSFSPYEVRRHEGVADTYSVFQPDDSDPERSLQLMRSQYPDPSLSAYVIVFDGRVTVEGARKDAVIIEGAVRGEDAAQVWAVPYARDPESGEPKPEGLFQIGTGLSKFSAFASEGAPPELPVVWTSPSAQAYAPLRTDTARYADLFSRACSTRGKFSIGYTLADLPEVLLGSGLSGIHTKNLTRLIEHVRSRFVGKDGSLGRASNGLTFHESHRPLLYPHTIVACAERTTQLKTARGDAALFIDPGNYQVSLLLGDSPPPIPTFVRSSSGFLGKDGLLATKILFLPFPPTQPGARLFRWLVDLFTELAAAMTFEILSFWVKVHAGYQFAAENYRVAESERYSDPIFTSSVRIAREFAALDEGLYTLVMTGSRMSAERAVLGLLKQELGVEKLVKDKESALLLRPYPAIRYVPFDRHFVFSNLTTDLQNIPDDAEDIIDKIIASIPKCLAELDKLRKRFES